jgi:hypothetical protein
MILTINNKQLEVKAHQKIEFIPSGEFDCVLYALDGYQKVRFHKDETRIEHITTHTDKIERPYIRLYLSKMSSCNTYILNPFSSALFSDYSKVHTHIVINSIKYLFRRSVEDGLNQCKIKKVPVYRYSNKIISTDRGIFRD